MIAHEKSNPQGPAVPDTPVKTTKGGISRKRFVKLGATTLTIVFPSREDLPGDKLPFDEESTLKKVKFFHRIQKPRINPEVSYIEREDGYILCEITQKNVGTLQYQLNRVGGELFKACNGRLTVGTIAEKVAQKFSLDEVTFLEEAESYFHILQNQNLILAEE